MLLLFFLADTFLEIGGYLHFLADYFQFINFTKLDKESIQVYKSLASDLFENYFLELSPLFCSILELNKASMFHSNEFYGPIFKNLPNPKLNSS